MATPTYRDLQKLTGLSLSTISRYFNGDVLRSKSVALIEEAISSLNYKPHHTTYVNKKQKSNVVGLLFPHITNSPFYMWLCRELEKAFGERGMRTFVCNFAGKSDYDEKAAIELLLDNHVCAIVAIPNDDEILNLINLQNRNIPIVLLDKLNSDIKTDAVIVDNKLAAAMAVEEFYQNNHKRIAILAMGHGYTSKLRIEGFTEALQKYGLPVIEQYILDVSLNEDDMLIEIERFFEQKNLPTAIFCANCKVLNTCLAIMKDRKIKIPDDISVIGADDRNISKITNPTLTMIMQPVEKIANYAADITINKITGKQDHDSYYTLELPASLIKGESVKKI